MSAKASLFNSVEADVVDFWTDELKSLHDSIPFDGIWIDMNEASSFCDGSCGKATLAGRSTDSLGDTFQSIASDSKIQKVLGSSNDSSEYQGVSRSSNLDSSGRNLNFPPYVINNWHKGHSLLKGSISPNATHNDKYNSTEYDFHNVGRRHIPDGDKLRSHIPVRSTAI